jgi:predicted phosphodiesterase
VKVSASQTRSELVDELLAKPVGPVRPVAPAPTEFTRSLELSGNTLTAEIRGEEGTVNEGTGLDYLTEEGLNPDEWEAIGFRKGKWGEPGAPFESVRFTYRRKLTELEAERPPIDELIQVIETHVPSATRPGGTYGALVLIGDMQFGKTDGDGVSGTLERTISCINKAADRIETLREIQDIGHIEVAWLGDHIEGFVSQGGANAWRTDLTLNEQIRLTRRVMLHALLTFSPMAETVSMVAVPGNHGEAVRFAGKGVTRYDDSHDTESLIAVSDAAALNPGAFDHVQFYVPETDELVVTTEVAGTNIAYAHGHQWRPGKHFLWWKGQAFSKESVMWAVDLLAAGHLHHEEVDSDGDRTYIGVPALEDESTWWRHATGTGGSPGIMLVLVRDGRADHKEVIR